VSDLKNLERLEALEARMEALERRVAHSEEESRQRGDKILARMDNVANTLAVHIEKSDKIITIYDSVATTVKVLNFVQRAGIWAVKWAVILGTAGAGYYHLILPPTAEKPPAPMSDTE
jgi:hypothetical protein